MVRHLRMREGLRLLQERGHSLHPPYAILTALKRIHPDGDCGLARISMYDAEVDIALDRQHKGKKSRIESFVNRRGSRR